MYALLFANEAEEDVVVGDGVAATILVSDINQGLQDLVRAFRAIDHPRYFNRPKKNSTWGKID